MSSDTLALIKDVLGVLLLFLVVLMLVAFIWTMYRRRGDADRDRYVHKCGACGSEFRCRAKPVDTVLAADGSVQRTAAAASTVAKSETAPGVIETVQSQSATAGPGAIRVDNTGRVIYRRRVTRQPDVRHAAKGPSPASATAIRASQRRVAPANTFERKTVYVGAFPIEVSEPANKTCCATYVGHGKAPERFCSYSCYRKYTKASARNAPRWAAQGQT